MELTRTRQLRVPSLHDAATERVLSSTLPTELAYAFGGPFHVLLPVAFDANVAAIRSAFSDHDLPGRLYYAKKANKAAVWPQRCVANGVGVDVASLGELRDALGHGVRGEDVLVTGPTKSTELLRLASRHTATITIDDPTELASLITVLQADHAARPTSVLLRRRPPAQPRSRFGMDDATVGAALDLIVDHADLVQLLGFSVHLSGYSIDDRIDATHDLISLCESARQRGLEPSLIDLGGGLPVRYTDEDSWRTFLSDRTEDDFHAGHDFEDSDFYPYYSALAGADAAHALLRAVAAQVRRAGLGLALEPGRALLDGAGFSVFAIQGVKACGEYDLLTVDGSSLSLSEQWFGSEFVPDPVLLPGSVPDGSPRRASVGGVSCLESDMLTWRKIELSRQPQVGDLLAYLNTAGYQMDSNESSFHELPLPPKVVVDGWRDADRPYWRLDRHPG